MVPSVMSVRALLTVYPSVGLYPTRARHGVLC
jgi:hypothetical protein